MGKFCEVCEKGLMSGHNVSHSNRKSNRRWAPNVQKVHVLVDGKPTHTNVCTRCLRSGLVQRAMHEIKVVEVEAPVAEVAVVEEA